jgi:hypothetical protein
MIELLNDNINITKSIQKNKLVYKRHDWFDEVNIPLLIMIPSIIWIILMSSMPKGINGLLLCGHISALLFLIIGFFSIYINLLKTQKFQSIDTELSEIENREMVLTISNKLDIVTYYNKKNLFRGTYNKLSPFKQIVSIIYHKDKILFNSRNICIGFNGKIGRPPWGLKSSEKLYLLYKKEIEEYLKIYKKQKE